MLWRGLNEEDDMKVVCETKDGGSVQFSEKDGVWASYAVAGGLSEAPELFYAGVGLPDGRSVNLFVNRETGLVVVDVVDPDGKAGVEVLRRKVVR